jgi:hypothetical protein
VTGTRTGTDPQSLVVVVFSEDGSGSYEWLARSGWVDLATTSTYRIRSTAGPTQCADADAVRRFSGDRLLFSSSGNTTDPAEPAISPHGLPETYVVGAVDGSGRTWLPGHPEESDPWFAAGNIGRPYETGERFSYRAAAPSGYAATTHFGGTSGATPLTAGWAARLVRHARVVVRSTTGTTAGALAAGPRRTARGPLDDGRFTTTELRALLHGVAVQHSGLPSGAAYPAEGYGALSASSIRLAERILDGAVAAPERAADDQVDAVVHQVRAAAFSRC